MKRTLSAALILLGLILASSPTANTSNPAPAPAQAAETGVTMLIASDPQLHWWRSGDDPDCKSDSCKKGKASETNRNLVSAMNDVTSLGQWPSTLGAGAGATVGTPSGVIINGDLTSYWHEEEFGDFVSIYRFGSVFGSPVTPPLAFQMYPGLGNHDYHNNVGDCNYNYLYWGAGSLRDANRCAKEAVWFMANRIDRMLPNIVNKDLTGYVSLENKGAFVARLFVDYDYEGDRVSKGSGTFEASQRRGIVIPRGATNVKTRFQIHTGLKWSTVATRSASATDANCFKVTNTTFNPDWGKTDCIKEWPAGSKGSLSYSFEIGDYHFVQLQYRPDYHVKMDTKTVDGPVTTYKINESPGFEVTTSYDWLKKDLAAATAADKHIVINMHDATDGGCGDRCDYDGRVTDDPLFVDAIKDQNVVAIFAGHYHADYGKYGATLNNGVYDIPVILSGSAECERFLIADFNRKYFNVAVVNSSGGNPAFVTDPNDVCDARYSTDPTRYKDISGYSRNGANPAPKTYVVNKPPTITGSMNTAAALEGSPLSFSASASDPDGDPVSVTWNFGDGQTAKGHFATHTYKDNGLYNVSVTANDGYERGTKTHTFQVSVQNVAPAMTSAGTTVSEDGTAVHNGTITDPGVNDSFTLVVNWGEGQPQSVSLPAGTTSYVVSHKYLDDNPTGTSSDSYAVAFQVTDDDGGSVQSAAIDTVVNVNPVVNSDRIVDQGGQEVGPSDVLLVGLPVTSYESYADTGSQDTRTATRNWGDSTPTEHIGAVTSATNGAHTYGQPGTYVLSLSVTDDDTGVGGATRQLQVVTPSEATSAAVASLSALTSSSASAQASLSAAIADLNGNNDGQANNGAFEKLRRGANTAALVKLEHAVRNLNAAEAADASLDLTRHKSLLALVAKSVAVDAIARTEAAPTKRGHSLLPLAKEFLAQGQLLLDARNYTAAIKKFRDALSRTQFA